MKFIGGFKLGLLLIFLIPNLGCDAFKYGYTENKALNSYYLVTDSKRNFGKKRINYNESFHNCPCFTNFLQARGYPAFIYEYKTDLKCKGIKLFYPSSDSVFVFEESKKGKHYSFIKESKNMDEAEKLTYERIKSGYL